MGFQGRPFRTPSSLAPLLFSLLPLLTPPSSRPSQLQFSKIISHPLLWSIVSNNALSRVFKQTNITNYFIIAHHFSGLNRQTLPRAPFPSRFDRFRLHFAPYSHLFPLRLLIFFPPSLFHSLTFSPSLSLLHSLTLSLSNFLTFSLSHFLSFTP